MPSPTESRTSPLDSILTPRRLTILATVFVAAVAILHLLGLLAVSASPTHLGISRYFPVSYFHPRLPDLPEAGAAIVSLALLAGGLPLLRRTPPRFRLVLMALLGLMTILATTAEQGYDRGFVYPTAGREPRAGGQQYWHDAEERRIETPADAGRFLRDFDAIQPTLHEHARTHPPGAVLFYAMLRAVTGDRPAAATIIITVLAVALAALGIVIWSREATEPSDTTPLLLLLLPAVQIYFCATLDAVVAGLLFVAVAALLRLRGPMSLLLMVTAVVIASFLTFGWVWGVPVLLVGEIAVRHRDRQALLLWRTAAALLGVAATYGVLFAIFRFQYVVAFRMASHLENPNGFRLFADPAAYLATRIEDIAELAVFCGPVVLWLIPRGLRVLRTVDRQAFAVCIAAAGTLLALFLTGAFRTGETARGCLFIFPFLLLPAVAAPLSDRDRETLCRAVFLQSVLMQCFGFYFW